MEEIWNRFVENMAGRVSGPMKLRLFLQPTMASIFAIRAGLADAKVGRAPYFWGLLTNPTARSDMLRDGWKSVGKVFVIALALDVVYQLKELHTVYPIEALIVALTLAIVPYLLPGPGHVSASRSSSKGRSW
jgi:hypothetical protein